MIRKDKWSALKRKDQRTICSEVRNLMRCEGKKGCIDGKYYDKNGVARGGEGGTIYNRAFLAWLYFLLFIEGSLKMKRSCFIKDSKICFTVLIKSWTVLAISS